MCKKTINLTSLNITIDELITVIYHTTGKNFNYEKELYDYRNYNSLLDIIFLYLSDYKIIIKDLFPSKEIELFFVNKWNFPYKKLNKDKHIDLIKDQIYTCVVLNLRLFKQYNVNFEIINKESIKKLRTSSSVLYNWLQEKHEDKICNTCSKITNDSEMMEDEDGDILCQNCYERIGDSIFEKLKL